MAQASRQRLARARQARSEAALLAECAAAAPAPPLVAGEFGLIAEIKRTSPAEGALEPETDVARRAGLYAEAGVAAVSVLTEPSRFGGSLGDLALAADALREPAVPAMRKDFLVAPWQVLEARAAGAGGVLLILAMLEDGVAREMMGAAREQGMFVLLEAFDEADLDRAGALLPGGDGPPVLVGVNTRDLRTLEVDPQRLEALAARLPEGAPGVAESGILSPEDAGAAAALGYRMALVGTALMRSPAPGDLAREMIEHGRRALS